MSCPEPGCARRLPQRLSAGKVCPTLYSVFVAQSLSARCSLVTTQLLSPGRGPGLVLQVEEARALAEAIDGSSLWPCLGEEEVTRCPLCGAAGPVYANRACGHGACEGCWLADLEDKLRWGRENAAMDIPCVHKGCSEGCFETLGLFESPLLEEVGLFVREAKRKVQELSPWCARGPPAAAGPLCPCA